MEGKAITIHLRFDVIDRLSLEIMRGFGAVPRRGAEVGGVLLGRSEAGDGTTVYIEEFEAVPCEYRHGPTYQLSDGDLEKFDAVLERWKPETNPQVYPVGYYRSTTRDGLGIGEEDVALFNARFPSASDVILQVKPYATRVSVGGFFFREGDSIHMESTYLEFPFRRKELGGGLGPRMATRRGREEGYATPGDDPAASYDPESTPSAPPAPFAAAADVPDFQPLRQPEFTERPAPAPAKSTGRKGNVWIPLSFIFLLLGVLLGFQAAITTRPQTAVGLANPYSLGLRLTRSGDQIHIRWDRTAPAIKTARRGVLSISDGPINKPVDLDAATLQNGSVIYHHVSPGLSFRLEVFPSENTSLSEAIQASFDRIPAEMPARPPEK